MMRTYVGESSEYTAYSSCEEPRVKKEPLLGCVPGIVRYGIPSLSESKYLPNRSSLSNCSAVNTFPLLYCLSGFHFNGSEMWSFIPKSKSVSSITGVCNSSAKSKVSAIISKHSAGVDGIKNTCLVSP